MYGPKWCAISPALYVAMKTSLDCILVCLGAREGLTITKLFEATQVVLDVQVEAQVEVDVLEFLGIFIFTRSCS